MAKPQLKKQAIKLRKEGKTYSEILEKVPVAKSTLSRWLKDVGLSKPQKQRITEKRRAAQKRGAEAKRQQRIEKTKRIKEKARKEIGDISERELWLIGVALYWAEGTKEKPNRPSVSMAFANSDGEMIRLYVKWLVDIVGVEKDELDCGIYIHEGHKERIEEVKAHWRECTGMPEGTFDYVYYKDHNPKTVRKNTGDDYYGMLRIRVRASTDTNRKVMGWIEGILQEV